MLGGWFTLADYPNRLFVRIGVSFEDHEVEVKRLLRENARASGRLGLAALGGSVLTMQVGNDKPGVAGPTYQLSRTVEAQPRDIVILGSDDMRPAPFWDVWVTKQFDGFDGCLLVNDGYQIGECVTIPIMTFGCLQRLNKIIYHPAYSHAYSDSELYDVLKEMNLLKNLRMEGVVFEHIHWVANNKRVKDEWDHRAVSHFYEDQALYNKRKMLSLEEKLKVEGP
jgi:hypothetical protein